MHNSKIVKPKLEALAVAEGQMEAANKALAAAEGRLAACNEKLAGLPLPSCVEGVHRFGVPVPLRPIPISTFKHQYSSRPRCSPVYFMSWPSWLMREVLQLESTHCDDKINCYCLIS